jgi:phospholipase/carboxylesterase
MNRFFIRDEFGVFDQENIHLEADNVYAFTNQLIENTGLRRENILFLGYSNGANIILASIFYHPDIVQHAVLLHPMLPFTPKQELPALQKFSCFVSLGVADEIVSYNESMAVVSSLKSCGAHVHAKEYPFGHQITQEEYKDIIDFCRNSV